VVARLDQAAALAALERGEVIALPTDTVYGLAARLDSPEAIAEIFVLKQRPFDVALPVLISGSAQLASLGVAWPPEAERLAEQFWPGPLTIVVPVGEKLARRTGASSAIGFRVPAQRMVRELLFASGPLCVTSANRHGAPPCVSAHEVATVFAATTLGGVVDGGDCAGEVSTVVSLEDGWRVLRAGAVSTERLTALLGPSTPR
jgi:L-threonylcarbamoyladenylate synthase